MRVAVLGSGVVGVTTAWYAARAGHEVTVLDRQPGPALETSFANAGEVSPGYAAPWAAPGIPLKAIKWLFMKHRPLVIWPQFDPAQWQFVLMMLRNCTTDRYARNKSRMLPLAAYSRDCLQDLRKQTGIRYDERAQGTLQLFRTTKQLDGAARDMALLERFGVAHELLDVPGCLLAEPGLRHVSHRIAGGLRLPGDETGDCQMFTAALAERAAAAGVEFRNEVTIRALLTDGDRIGKVHTDQGDVEAEAYVMALGSYSPLVLRPIRPEDGVQHLAFLERLAPADIRMRVFYSRRSIERSELARLTQIDYEREMAFIAVDAEGQTLAVVRAVADPDNIAAEFGIVVRSDLKGGGLGERMMRKMIGYLQARGTQVLTATVLAENTRMLELARDLGFEVGARSADGVREVRLPL